MKTEITRDPADVKKIKGNVKNNFIPINSTFRLNRQIP